MNQITVQVEREERLYSDDGTPLVAVTLSPVIMTIEAHKKFSGVMKEHTINLSYGAK